MEALQQTWQLIEETLQSLGIEPEQARNEDPGQWTVYREKLEVYIDAWSVGKEQNPFLYFPADDQVLLQVICPICLVPEGREVEFFEEIADLNLYMIKACLMVRSENNVVCVKYRDSAMGLTREKMLEALDAVAYYGEMYANNFAQRYGVSILERQDS